MTREIRWTKRAVRRLDQIGAHIAQDDPDAAARVVARIMAGVDLLGAHPAMGRVGRIKETRELVFADIPYIVLIGFAPRRSNPDDHVYRPKMAGQLVVERRPITKAAAPSANKQRPCSLRTIPIEPMDQLA